MIAKCIEEVSSPHTPNTTNTTSTNTSDGTSGIADSILTHVYRYLCGYGNGLLSDPLLHRVIYGLMTKLFQKLVGNLRRLGTKVVYADFGRIIISTDKHVSTLLEFLCSFFCSKGTTMDFVTRYNYLSITTTLSFLTLSYHCTHHYTSIQDFASASEYVEFILAALGNKPTFSYLQVCLLNIGV